MLKRLPPSSTYLYLLPLSILYIQKRKSPSISYTLREGLYGINSWLSGKREGETLTKTLCASLRKYRRKKRKEEEKEGNNEGVYV